jgi:hypothetical protein
MMAFKTLAKLLLFAVLPAVSAEVRALLAAGLLGGVFASGELRLLHMQDARSSYFFYPILYDTVLQKVLNRPDHADIANDVIRMRFVYASSEDGQLSKEFYDQVDDYDPCIVSGSDNTNLGKYVAANSVAYVTAEDASGKSVIDMQGYATAISLSGILLGNGALVLAMLLKYFQTQGWDKATVVLQEENIPLKEVFLQMGVNAGIHLNLLFWDTSVTKPKIDSILANSKSKASASWFG